MGSIRRRGGTRTLRSKARRVTFELDVVEFANLLKNGPKTGLRLVDWFLEYPNPSKYRKSVGVRDARFVFNHLRTPNYFLDISADLAKAGALPPDG
jgi:hypothetical protein